MAGPLDKPSVLDEDPSLTDTMAGAMDRMEEARDPSFDEEAALEMDSINGMDDGREKNQRVDALFLKMRDKIKELQAESHRFKKRGELDPLTEISNRRGFEAEVLGDPEDPYHKGTLELFEEERASAHQREGESDWDKEYVLFFLDIDDFKDFNTKFGEAGGDAALKVFAAALAHFVRDNDVVGRLGGEEFLIQMVTKNKGDRVAVVNRLLEAIRKIRVNIKGRQIPLTASVGMAKLKDGEDYESLVARANEGMQDAKEKGKNTWSLPADER